MNLLPSLGVVAKFESVKQSHRVLRLDEMTDATTRAQLSRHKAENDHERQGKKNNKL